MKVLNFQNYGFKCRENRLRSCTKILGCRKFSSLERKIYSCCNRGREPYVTRQKKKKISVLYWIFVNRITKCSISQTRKQLPLPTLIQLGSIIPGKLGVILVLQSGDVRLRMPLLEHLLKCRTQHRPKERLRGHIMKLEFMGNALQGDRDPIVLSLCL